MLSSCSNTGPQTGTLSGTINLEGQSDHSNITIGVYKLAELDPDIVAINQEYPFIGVIINQHTEFDHRFGTLVKAGETDASGYFEINDIPTGVYNVVAIKDSFGFRYIYNVQINNGDNSITEKRKKDNIDENSSFNLLPLSFNLEGSKADLTLYPETVINSDITEPTIFESHHHYIIEQDIIVDNELTIEPGAVIRLNQGKDITSYGTFNAVGEYENFIWFTKNDGFSENLNTIEPDSNYIWDKVTLEPYSLTQVQWCKFDWANIGLLNHVNGFEISDCIIKESQCGFKTEDVDSTFCSNFNIKKIKTSPAILFFGCDGEINKLIITECKTGIETRDWSDPDIFNNYIFDADICIISSFNSKPKIKNNILILSDIGIQITNYSNPSIIENNIASNDCITLTMLYQPNILVVNLNNLNADIYCIKEIPHSTLSLANVDAEDNYFYTTIVSKIEDKIFDKFDAPPSQQYLFGIVDFEPFLNYECSSAGISK